MPAESVIGVCFVIAIFVVFMVSLFWAWTQAH